MKKNMFSRNGVSVWSVNDGGRYSRVKYQVQVGSRLVYESEIYENAMTVAAIKADELWNN